jgi:RNA polymerase sigma factor (sigma-70 family)
LEINRVSHDDGVEVVKQYATLAQEYEAPPAYSTSAFWYTLEDTSIAIEVLVRCLRLCIASQDHAKRNCILEWIIKRIQTSNEYWASNVLKNLSVPSDERQALLADLYADLCENVVRALLDGKRLFWEENFFRCLHFAQMHTYHAFMLREGYWRDYRMQKGTRIPRVLMIRLEQMIQQNDEASTYFVNPEDERAQKMLLSVEQMDILQLVHLLPEKLKTTILLIFWEGRTEKEVARTLGITDRTVRNRISKALQLLQCLLERESALS